MSTRHSSTAWACSDAASVGADASTRAVTVVEGAVGERCRREVRDERARGRRRRPRARRPSSATTSVGDRAGGHQAGDADRAPAAARGWRCARRRATSAGSASTRAQQPRRRPRARPAARVRAVGRAPRPPSARSSIAAPAPPAASGTAIPGAPTATSCSHSSGEKPERLVVAEAVEGNGALGQRPEHVDDRLLLVGRVEVHGFVYNIRDARPDLPGAARGGAVGGQRRPTAVALEHVDGAALTYAELDRRARAWAGALRGRAAWPRATTSPRCCPTRSTPTSRCSPWRGCASVEVPLNVAFTGRMLAYSLDHADVTTLVVAPEFRRRGGRGRGRRSRCWRGHRRSTTRRAPCSTPARRDRSSSSGRSTATCTR